MSYKEVIHTDSLVWVIFCIFLCLLQLFNIVKVIRVVFLNKECKLVPWVDLRFVSSQLCLYLFVACGTLPHTLIGVCQNIFQNKESSNHYWMYMYLPNGFTPEKTVQAFKTELGSKTLSSECVQYRMVGSLSIIIFFTVD